MEETMQVYVVKSLAFRHINFIRIESHFFIFENLKMFNAF